MDLFAFDDDYVRRLRDRDPRTEEHFLAHFTPRLFNYLRRRVRSPADIEEKRQDTFERVLSAIYAGKLRDGRTLAGFVFGVCHKILLEHWRAPETENIDDHVEPANDQPDQEQAMITEERKRAVHRVLNDMKPPGGDILRANMQGVPNDEICARFGITRDYLRVLLFRARAEFREKYLAHDETDGDESSLPR
ncbi:MAG TPA: sigma-70 family RNA polymerase sigma factor [Thermoanaerobaculia bacterium]